ncbi:hypothetical protein GCM10023205_37450 [Yinghuangia aomiensis]|uniref:Lipoprotein n=1 Tax=Yinghuangia aomiensis TaxID=676205 RepID=A0ABP9HDR6_9ACTN
MRRIRGGAAALAMTAAAVAVLAGCSDGDSDGGSKASGRSDFATACSLVQQLPPRMPDLPPSGGQFGDYDRATNRLGAASLLAANAAADDPKHQPLADTLKHAQDAIARTFDIHQSEPDIAKARGMC